MRFNDLLHLVATLAPRLDRGDSLGRRMGDLRHLVSSLQPRCRIPVRFPSFQTISALTYPCQLAFRGSGACSKHSNRDSAASISTHSQLSLP